MLSNTREKTLPDPRHHFAYMGLLSPESPPHVAGEGREVPHGQQDPIHAIAQAHCQPWRCGRYSIELAHYVVHDPDCVRAHPERSSTQHSQEGFAADMSWYGC